VALAASGLAGSDRLAVLDLSENRIGCSGAAAIAGAIESAGARTALRQLDLGFNRIGDAGAAALASMLTAVPSIAALELERNQVGDEGAQALADAIKATPSIQRLNLNFNKITGEGIASIAEALLTSPGSLQELTLAGSPDAGAVESVAMLLRAVPASGCPLQLLDVRGPPLEGDAIEAMAALLASPGVPLVTLRADVARKDDAERIAQVRVMVGCYWVLLLGGVGGGGIPQKQRRCSPATPR